MLLWLVLWWLLLLYLVALVARAIVDWVQVASRTWRPTGVVLVLVEAAFTVTDPPLRFVRRFVRPLRIGAVAIDLAYTIVFLVCLVAWQIVGGLAR